MMLIPDPSLDSLLDLDGQILVLDQDTRHWVRFSWCGACLQPIKSRMASIIR
jgi:hypothetical protein